MAKLLGAEKSWFRRWGIWLGGVIVAWIIGHILDRTTIGVVVLWGKALSIVSFGSARVRDSSYAIASAGVSAPAFGSLLFVLFSCAYSLLSSNVSTMIRGQLATAEVSLKEQNDDVSTAPIGKYSVLKIFTFLDRLIYTFFVPFTVFVALLLGMGFGAIAVEAYSIRDIYETDLNIVSPFLDQHHIAMIRAEFAHVRTQEQYRVLIKELSTIAASNGVKLREER